MKRLVVIIFALFSIVASNNSELTLGQWLKQKDSTSKVTFEAAQGKGYVNSLKFVASEDIKSGQVVYSYPLEGLLGVEEALADERMGAVFKSLQWPPEKQKGPPDETVPLGLYNDQIAKLFLIYLKHHPMDKWNTYLGSLPTSMNTPLFWEDSEIEELKGSELYRGTYKLRATLKAEYGYLFPKLTELHPTLFPESEFTYGEYLWAYAVFNSRNWAPKGVAILPLTEAFNFKKESAVTFEEKEGALRLVAKKDIPSGEEVVVNDGLLGNRDLLEIFGFVLDRNDEDYISVAVSMDDEDKMYGNKKQTLKRKGLKDGQIYKLKASQIPLDLVFALRIYHTSVYDYEDMENAFKGKMVSSQNELKVAEMLVDLCHETLKGYTTSSKEDKALLKSELAPRHRMAVLLRRGEKKILSKTLSRARGAIQQVRQNWDMRSMDIPGTEELTAKLISTDSDDIL